MIEQIFKNNELESLLSFRNNYTLHFYTEFRHNAIIAILSCIT